jgi:hypothetical protein
MNRTSTLLTVCYLIALGAGVALAQPSGDHKTKPVGDAKPMQPAKAEPKKGDMPAGMPSQQECMQAMMEAATPGPMHEWLYKGCGTWEGKCKMWETPDSTPTESACTTILTPMMDGRFVRNETSGDMDMGGMKFPFQGFGVAGYNNTTKEFESTWIDNMGTMQMHSTGTLSADKKTLTMEAHYMCPIMKKNTFMREVHTHTGPETMKLEMYGPDMTGKQKEYKIMEITYTRKAGTAPKEMPKPAMPTMPAGEKKPGN